MPTWFLLTISSVMVLAVAEIAQKIAVTRKDDISAEANNFVVWMIQSVMAIIYMVVIGQHLPTMTLSLLSKLFILGSIYFWAGKFYYTSFKEGSVSISGILVSLSIVVTTLLGILFFKESLNPLKFFGSVIILFAVFLLNYEKGVTWKKANSYALIGAVLFGTGYTIDKLFSLQLSPHVYQVLFALSGGLAGLVYRGRVIVSDVKRVEINTVKVMIISALSFFAWNKLNFIAYSIGGEVGKIDSINNSVIFVIILLEYFLLKDKSNIKKKVVAAIISFVGVALLAIAK